MLIVVRAFTGRRIRTVPARLCANDLSAVEK
jgi:hypothetical protein